MYPASNAVIEWLLVVKMLETEIHLFRYSLFRVLQIPVIFVEENFTYTQDHALVMFLYYDFNLSLISSCKKQRANMHFN